MLLPVLLVICLLGLPAEAEYGGGTGQPEDPYLIYTDEQMNEIGANSNDWDKHFKLMADIDLSKYEGTDFNIIGRSRTNVFSGVFDGNNNKISNFTYTAESRHYSGLFGYLNGSEAEIRNLGFIDPNVDVGSGACVGPLVGYAYEGTFTNCYVRGGSISGKTSVGGLIGNINRGTITNCHTEGGSISGNEEVGGLVGHNRAGIEDCYSTCSVSGNMVVGGLVGHNRAGIEDCYSACSVSGNKVVGGLVGENRNGKIVNSSATGMVSAGEDVGGLVGENTGPVTNCFAGGDILGGKLAGGLVGKNSSIITNSCSSGNISGDDNVGGLVGQSHGVTISNCKATGTVSGDSNVGGLVGSSSGVKIRNCYATGIVSGVQDVGGLVGVNSSRMTIGDYWLLGRIANCYSVGSVTGTTNVGGLVGKNREGEISTSFSVGSVTGTTDVGGLVGMNREGEISTSSFWDIQTSGRSRMCGWQNQGTGCDDGNGKTTAEMQTESTFLDAGWDFVAESVNGTEDIWSICEGLDYPKLASQFLIGDFDDDSRVDFVDFAVFAERWLSSDSNLLWCRGADLTNDGNVDFFDLKEFAENWLADGIVSPATIGYVIIDDFESYNDLAPNDPERNRIFDKWLDGYNNPEANGSVVGNDNPPFTERSIVHGGMQSMPYSYNTISKLSKAELPLSPPQDWTEVGAGVLSLWFHGGASNAASLMSVVLNGSSVVYHDNPNAVRIDTWTEWTIDMQAFTGIDLTNVNSIAICFGREYVPQPGGLGKMFFDDIRLYGFR